MVTASPAITTRSCNRWSSVCFPPLRSIPTSKNTLSADSSRPPGKNSVRTTLIGVLLGLLVTGWAMGFMAMLGILSLGGIVINNAIVLVDFIETKVAEGADLRQAIASAWRQRMRPIVLTTLTTIGGLLPLSLFGGALWAPMTNGMIFGLVFSTVLTLVVVPTMYLVFVERFGMKVGARRLTDSIAV